MISVLFTILLFGILLLLSGFAGFVSYSFNSQSSSLTGASVNVCTLNQLGMMPGSKWRWKSKNVTLILGVISNEPPQWVLASDLYFAPYQAELRNKSPNKTQCVGYATSRTSNKLKVEFGFDAAVENVIRIVYMDNVNGIPVADFTKII